MIQNTWTGEVADYNNVTHIAVKQVSDFIMAEYPFEHMLSNYSYDNAIALFFDENEIAFKLFNADKWEIHCQG